ncbi:MAG: hypothetical protein HZB65_02600 [Candidatus Aenigmarchaeota archaeon]|nr:hypothetical protein [Candidatus Aenigmarchaeota archaeon]
MLLSEETEPRFFELEKRGFITNSDDIEYLQYLQTNYSNDPRLFNLVVKEVLPDDMFTRIEALLNISYNKLFENRRQAPNRIDMHTHSHSSDAYPTPCASVLEAYERGIRVLGALNHDTFSGICERMLAGKILGMRVVPGIEISFGDSVLGHRVNNHIGVYFPEIESYDQFKVFLDLPDTFPFIERMEGIARKRHESYLNLVDVYNSNAPFGVEISTEDVLRFARGGMVFGSHCGMALFDRYVKEMVMKDAKDGEKQFAKCIEFYSEEETIVGAELKEMMKDGWNLPTLEEVFEYAQKYHGAGVLVHPLDYHSDTDCALDIMEKIAELYRVSGIEVYVAKYPDKVPLIKERADKINSGQLYNGGLVYSFGSDHHGKYGGSKQVMGGLEKFDLPSPSEFLERLRANCF